MRHQGHLELRLHPPQRSDHRPRQERELADVVSPAFPPVGEAEVISAKKIHFSKK